MHLFTSEKADSYLISSLSPPLSLVRSPPVHWPTTPPLSSHLPIQPRSPTLLRRSCPIINTSALIERVLVPIDICHGGFDANVQDARCWFFDAFVQETHVFV